MLNGRGIKLNIKEAQKEIHGIAVSKGWYANSALNLPEALCLIHSELSEALEKYRMGYDPSGPVIATELADVIIRTLDLAEYLNIDMEDIIRKKMDYNKTRRYRHGNMRC